ncbi:putative transporter [Jeotgalibacillus terrae]|nr:putative transporter [Jeotgalibacillus terrae]
MKIFLFIVISILAGIALDFANLMEESNIFISGSFGLLLYISIEISNLKND